MSRTRRLLVGAASTVVGKGAVFLSTFASIPIMVRYLGAEQFGIWMTISTVVTTLLVLDLGIASALVNFISEAYAKDDREQASSYSSTAFGIMVALAFLLAGVARLIWPYLDWANLFHLTSPGEIPLVSHAWAAAVIVFLLGMPAGLAMKILGGYQELRSANLFTSAGSLSSLVLIVLLVRFHAGFVTLVAASSAALVGANVLCLLWLWFFHKPWLLPRVTHLSRSAAGRMVGAGGGFFVLQISALLAFNSDNLVVTHYLGPAQVASYSVAWRLAGFASIAQSVIAPAVWPAYSEAFARGDLPWVQRTFRRIMWTTMLTAFAFSLVFAFAGRWIIRLWASPAAVPTEHLMLLMCVWVLISTLMSNTSVILTGKGQTRLWAVTSLLAAALNLTLSIYWVQRIGAVGVVLGTVVSYLLLLVGPQIWQCSRLLKTQ
ncbi:lipopolysaccharide biosynthesis protein [Terriglobus sp.]|uniref:lipopolysaccharide biosynthesis protein n=1 Tax=Terriglobus sp. TaxID=1889013 RepID=UPI003B007241